jgi:uncharacterized membrane protein YoaK (UPF0700 family)
MSSAPGTATFAPGKDRGHGPLPALLLALTMVTGLVDAISYLRLGHVFVANMTGNIAFLGFAVADAREFSVAASLTATAAFLIGALAGGRLGHSEGNHRARFLATGILIEVAIVGVALVAATLTSDFDSEVARYELIVLLALVMGLQNAVARKLGVPDLTTTVLTLTLAGLAADSSFAGGQNPRAARRLLAAGIMLLGAALGAYVIFRFGIGAVLAIVFALLAASGFAAYRNAGSTEPWTLGA